MEDKSEVRELSLGGVDPNVDREEKKTELHPEAEAGNDDPHFMVKSESGLHHYRMTREMLPWPLCYLLFQGRFQTVPSGEESDFDKRSSYFFPSSRV